MLFMKNDALTKQQADAVLKALDTALEQGPWGESNFLKVIGRNLRAIRDDFFSQIDTTENDKAVASVHLANQAALRRGLQKVYIQLYSADGKNMRSWEWIVANLPQQMISRPIYENEEDVQAIIKIKENVINEAYVCIYIDQNNILPVSADKVPVDKLGKHRLTLKDGSLKLENMDGFVHQSGIYQYSQGRLIKS